jgi:hypothetical protein
VLRVPVNPVGWSAVLIVQGKKLDAVGKFGVNSQNPNFSITAAPIYDKQSKARDDALALTIQPASAPPYNVRPNPGDTDNINYTLTDGQGIESVDASDANADIGVIYQ